MRENVKNEVEKFIIYFSNRASDTKTTKRVISVNLHFNTSNFRNFSIHKARRGVVRRWNEQSRSQNMTMEKKICVLCGEKNWILTIWRLLGRGERDSWDFEPTVFFFFYCCCAFCFHHSLCSGLAELCSCALSTSWGLLLCVHRVSSVSSFFSASWPLLSLENEMSWKNI